MGAFDELVELKQAGGFACRIGSGRAVFAPDLGARVFCELNGLSLHRLDMDNIRSPNRPFNNYGGNNFWPAPEGGAFGFNYDGDTWRVQKAINDQPFVLEERSRTGARARKETALTNRKGVVLNVVMQREFAEAPVSPLLAELRPMAAMAYTVDDRIHVVNPATVEDALLACWSLEQFDATDATVSFACVGRSQSAINFDYYDHPGDRITYAARGFFYRTDGKKRGQIGIQMDHSPRSIGFFDLDRRLICLREIVPTLHGLHFNIADNDQRRGPFSAKDTYSIFNGDETMRFFELETIGGASVKNGYLKGSRLRSRTSFALFGEAESIRRFVDRVIGKRKA